MTWQLIDSDPGFAQGELRLYRDGEDFMIRSGGFELMNSRTRRSEIALAQIGLDVCTAANGRHILIAGLGLGFTLAEACRNAASQDRITVVEFSGAVIGWVQEFLEAETGRYLADSRVSLVHDDFLAFVAGTSGRYDLILVDIDNGPEAFVRDENSALYRGSGLQRLLGLLAPSGLLLVWSSFEAPAFQERLEALGAQVQCHLLQPKPGHPARHYIYQAIL